MTSAEDVSRAVEVAESAIGKFCWEPPLTRTQIVRDLAKLLREDADEFAYLDALDGGNPV